MSRINFRVIMSCLLATCLVTGSVANHAAMASNLQPEAISASWEMSRDAYFLTKLAGKEPATDSASAATAISTGYKTDDGNLAWLPGDPDGGNLTTIAEYLRSSDGLAIGVASTVMFSHATPAGFVSHNKSRNNYSAIANEIISTVIPEVVIGGGHPTYYPADYQFVGGNPTWDNLLAGATSYTDVITRQAGIPGGPGLINKAATVDLAAGDKLIGIFGGAGGNFEYNVPADAPGAPAVVQGSTENPTLGDVVTSTLKVLSQDPDGLFVMFEQGDIDWANHENNFKNMIGGMWDLDKAVKTAEAFIDQSGGPEWSDTLVIVTSDHSNSYMRLPYPLGKGDLPQQTWVDLNSNGRVDGGEWYYPNGEVTYRSINHTNELVTVSARGKGASLFAEYAGDWYPGSSIIDNSQLYAIMQRAVDDEAVKHVILFIGDGMNIEHEIAGSRYLYGSDNGLAWHKWGGFVDSYAGAVATWDVSTYNKYANAANPVQPAWVTPVSPVDLGSNNALLGYDAAKGGVKPYPLDTLAMGPYFLTKLAGKEPATDSASAATAISTGYKTDDGNLAWKPGDPLDGKLTTIAETLRSQLGIAIGVASTVMFSHATPAGFVSHNTSRNNYSAIANEIIYTVKPEVVIGGGHPTYYPADYQFVGGTDTWTDLLTGGTDYTQVAYRQTGLSGRIQLRNKAALVDLAAGDKLIGIFGGAGGNFEYNVPADAPGAPAVVQGSTENPTLGDVVTSTLKVLSQDPDGLFVMFEQGDIDWANHENNFKNMIGGMWDLDKAVKTSVDYINQPGGLEWNDTLVIVTSDHSNSYMRINKWLSKGDLPQQNWNVNKWEYPNGEISYSTTNHTNELVTLSARGKGASLFQDYVNTWLPDTQIIDNSQIYSAMRRAVNELGVRHVILFIGDGMNIEHEIAASRYLYGVDMGLAWHSWRTMQDGWAGYVSTWDVTTYNKYANAAVPPQPTWVTPTSPSSLGSNNALLGYDPVKGGPSPFPLQPGFGGMSLTPGFLSAELNPNGTVSPPAIAVAKTGNINLAWSVSESPDMAWLTITSPTSGYMIFDGSFNLTTNVDATGMAPGHYRTNIQLNTPYHKYTIPVLLKVKTAAAAPQACSNPFSLVFHGSYRTGIDTASEISAFDPESSQLYVTNAFSHTLDVLSLANINTVYTPTLATSIDLAPYGESVSSVDVHDGLLAVGMPADPVQDSGRVLFIQNSTMVTVTVGSLPDMVIFTPDGNKLLVANEGEPSTDYSVDPEGTISVIDVSGGIASIDQSKVTELDFGAFTANNIDPQIRIFGKNATIQQDLEPEYITVSDDSKTAWVTLQENNALAKVDLDPLSITHLIPLGYKDWSGLSGFDASDKDGTTINITNYPVKGSFMPDGIDSYHYNGVTYLVTGNEGDTRAYDALNEESRIKDLALDPVVFPNAAALKADPVLGRLKVSNANSNIDSAFVADPDHDGLVENLYAFGGRSLTIWNGETGALVYDSGDAFERITAANTPTVFNANYDTGTQTYKKDDRSDDKGPEPEGVTVAEIFGRVYAFVGLERAGGGVMAYDITNPLAPCYVLYQPNAQGDVSPEGLLFIPASDSPTHLPLLVLSNELSGSTAIFEVTPPYHFFLPSIYNHD